MNNVFLYQHENGVHFLSKASPLELEQIWYVPRKQPKCIGIWKFKEIKNIK